MTWEIVYAKLAVKDSKKAKENKILREKVLSLIEILRTNPFQVPPRYEKLVGG